MKLPTINITIGPTGTSTSHAEVKAQWKSPDNTQRTIRQVVTLSELEDYLGNIIVDVFETIKETEDKFYG